MPAISATSITQAADAARRDESGSVAIIFAISSFFLMMVTGLAIDVGRVMHVERSMASAIDAAALAAAKSMRSGLGDAAVEEVAQRYFDANMAGRGGTYGNIKSFSVSVDRAASSVRIDVQSDVPTIFANIAGITKVSVPKSSSAVFENKSIEVGLQLDVTGSMCQPCTKIDALKDAVAGPDGLLDILMPDNGSTNNVRVGLAPFAAGVNAGRYAAAASNGRAGASGCVYERRDLSLQNSDVAPTGAAALKVRADLPGASACPGNAEVVALSDDKSMLRNEVNSWRTGGSTAGHLGAAWAWYLVSPSWATVWGGTAPANYRSGTEKYVILMTDGIYNTVGGVSRGDTGPTAAQSKRFAGDTCGAMKDKGIVVYTIGFQVPASVKGDLRGCASAASKFYDANDADTLRDAFRAIASEINSLRLSS
ncbi:MAG: pilus assembly protein TadG-related protein [Hyphomicrobiaceae bacterium]|nr:pilus assembly protein TadG-related protein [Hyphomicrobiaceae bacterium]